MQASRLGKTGAAAAVAVDAFVRPGLDAWILAATAKIHRLAYLLRHPSLAMQQVAAAAPFATACCDPVGAGSGVPLSHHQSHLQLAVVAGRGKVLPE